MHNSLFWGSLNFRLNVSVESVKSMRVIGLMSGTSIDGIDVALVDVHGGDRDLKIELIAAQTVPYDPSLRQQILDLAGGAPIALADFADLDDAIATAFAQAAIAIQTDHAPAELIGSHGQTVYHQPPRPTLNPLANSIEDGSQHASDSDPHLDPSTLKLDRLGYSLQLGRGTTIAHLTGLPTISNFRAADIAAGGQGAPLVPRIDACLLGHVAQTTCVQNLGGIGNVTYIPRLRHLSSTITRSTIAGTYDPCLEQDFDRDIRGWDTGPGNLLIDLAVQLLSQGEQIFDRDGAWAATGRICHPLLDRWLSDPFFTQPPPKSTGREYFGLEFTQTCLSDAHSFDLNAADTIATLTELTAASIADSYRRFLPALPDRVLLCGGGSRNTYLRERIQAQLGSSCRVQTTDDVGLDADSKEAIAFAVLAYWRWHDIPGNLPSVTGAAHSALLGDMASPSIARSTT